MQSHNVMRQMPGNPGGQEGGTVKPGQTLPVTKQEVRCMSTCTQGQQSPRQALAAYWKRR